MGTPRGKRGDWGLLGQEERDALYRDLPGGHVSDETAHAMERVRWLKKLALSRELGDVLDVGCASGWACRWMGQVDGFRSYLGIDPCLQEILLAREGTSDPRFRFIPGSWQGQRPQKYDTVVAFEILEHFQQPELSQFARFLVESLRPGGRLYLTTPEAGGAYGLGNDDPCHLTLFTAQSLGRLFEGDLRCHVFQRGELLFLEGGPRHVAASTPFLQRPE